MFRKNSETNQSNFWISYADLMAGLLFVFILLIGAIVSKSILMRESLHTKESKLNQMERMLQKNELALQQKEKALKIQKNRLSKLQKELRVREKALKSGKNKISTQQNIIVEQKRKIIQIEQRVKLKEEEVKKLHNLLSELKDTLNQVKKENKKLSSNLKKEQSKSAKLAREKDALVVLHKNQLKLKEKDLETLNQLLLARNAKIDELNKKVIILQNLTNESNTTLDEKQKLIQKYVNKVIVLSGKLTKVENELKLKDEKLTKLLEALDAQKTQYDELIAKLQSQKAKIKSLTGIQLKVIAALKETLGNKIRVDKNTGALRLSSNILFDKGSSKLKKGAKAQLRAIFTKYIAALMSNRAIKPHLDRIVIEGHTDSDGGYIYNLELSQQRALAVMNYLLTLPISKEYNLKKYLVASGRAYLDPVMRNGREDKSASRRIEIKFQLKNRDAMHEIERILDETKN